MTELLAGLEGLERGPAGNTSLAAAFSIAQELPADCLLAVQETEYTGAGNHVQSQLTFARRSGLEVRLGDPAAEIPGASIILPAEPNLLRARDLDLDQMRRSLIRRALETRDSKPNGADIAFLALETKTDEDFVRRTIREYSEN